MYKIDCQLCLICPHNSLWPFNIHADKVATYCHVYWAEPKEPAQFGSVSGSEMQNLPFPPSGIVSLYRPEPNEPT